jgi:flavin-binding monooxygenase-like protein
VRICVIGSGVSGIAAVRTIPRTVANCSVHWLSEDAQAGGLWSTSARDGLVYDSLFLNTSRGPSAFTGTEIAAEPSTHFVHHSRYAVYLGEIAELAAEHAGVERHWECRVASVSVDQGGGWLLRWTTRTGVTQEATFDAIVDATGHNGQLKGPGVPVADDLAYDYVHSSAYRNPEPYHDRSVLVIGGSASAVDIACDLVPVASSVSISIRTPKWYLPKMLLGKPVDSSPDGWWSHAPVVGALSAHVAERLVRRILGSYRSYGLEDPPAPLAASTPVLNDYFLAHLSHGRLTALPQVVNLEQTSVQFADGASDKFDSVIAATGFRDSSPHLPEGVRAVLDSNRLGLALEAAGFPGLYLMNRFRCSDAAVRCAEVQASTIARSLRNRRTGFGPVPGMAPRTLSPMSVGTRITARMLRKVYREHR